MCSGLRSSWFISCCGLGFGGPETGNKPLNLKPCSMKAYPKALRTHILRLLGPKTILSKAFWGYSEP